MAVSTQTTSAQEAKERASPEAPAAEEVAPDGLFGRGLRLIVSYVRMHPGPFLVSLAGAILFAFASIALTTALGRATDEVLRPAFSGGVEMRRIWLAVAALMAFGCLRALGIMLRRFFSGVAGERVMATLRTRIADRYRRLALAYHRETPTGELLAHMEADVKAAVDLFWPVPFAAGVVVLIVLAMIQLIATDIFLAMIAAVVFPALAVMNRNFAKRMQGPARRAQERIGEVSAVAHESIDGALVVKTLGREAAETERLAIKARALRDERVEAGFLRATFEAALDALPALVAAILLLVGSWRVAAGGITLGRLIGFIALFDLLAWPMRFIGWILAELPRAVVGYSRIEQVFGEPVTVLPSVDPQPLPDGPLGLDVEDVHHGLDGTPILEGVSLRIGARESVAIVSQTGGGKSTLAQLLVRLADPDSGTVRIGGIDLRHAHPTSLRRAVSIVFQESFLFSTTIGENIALDSGADHVAVDRAARIAAVDRFVDTLPAGFQTVVGERGYTLSGGERQRVALARAIVREPRVLILDDATSSVDASVEAQILAALREELHTTLVVIAYRLSTIQLADRVIYLEDGRVAGTGAHDELMATSPGYAAIIHAYARGER
ncbi:MAG: Xenobiotic-transporting ATPase [Actinomycetia bacterium]|jgi:ABC-type multidrug transport system fused ATPase/permease subunit|nr:Xenobiotic-transporting ATPase [Actinomycetes bacterium]